MEYTVQKLARMAGLTPRTLRWYDQIGLLAPARVNENGYRLYGEKEADRLQEILLYRGMGVPLKEIAPLLSNSPQSRRQALKSHLEHLRRERERMDALICTVEQTLLAQEGGFFMETEKKFVGFKQEALEQNEKKYGKEIREKYGEEAVEESNAKWMGLSQGEYGRMQSLAHEIQQALEEAVLSHADPAGDAGKKIFEMHREWLCFTWGQYSPKAHCGLGEMYVADERFTAYYDKKTPGCAAFLRDAIAAHAGV